MENETIIMGRWSQAVARTGQRATLAVAPSAKKGRGRCVADVSAGWIILMVIVMMMMMIMMMIWHRESLGGWVLTSEIDSYCKILGLKSIFFPLAKIS